jgi:hypothetical protein
MKNFASRTGISLAVLAAVMSVVFALYVPYGYPWPSVAWAALACAAAVWMAKSSSRPTRLMSDVLRDVDAESPRTPAAPGR